MMIVRDVDRVDGGRLHRLDVVSNQVKQRLLGRIKGPRGSGKERLRR